LRFDLTKNTDGPPMSFLRKQESIFFAEGMDSGSSPE